MHGRWAPESPAMIHELFGWIGLQDVRHGSICAQKLDKYIFYHIISYVHQINIFSNYYLDESASRLCVMVLFVHKSGIRYLEK